MAKFCKDCKHYYSITDIVNEEIQERRRLSPGPHAFDWPIAVNLPPECRHPKSYKIYDLVRGQEETTACFRMRDDGVGECGTPGKLWESKNG